MSRLAFGPQVVLYGRIVHHKANIDVGRLLQVLPAWLFTSPSIQTLKGSIQTLEGPVKQGQGSKKQGCQGSEKQGQGSEKQGQGSEKQGQGSKKQGRGQKNKVFAPRHPQSHQGKDGHQADQAEHGHQAEDRRRCCVPQAGGPGGGWPP